MAINGYSIGGYQWLLIAISVMVISGYYIINYCWLLYVILQLLVIIAL